jgi:AcrR family transcriptional regulator
MPYNYLMTGPDFKSRTESSAAEPPRSRGRRTRTLILEQAAALFAGRTPDDVSLTEIAAAAGAFPSQVTYYFGSKDALFVHAAFRLLLHDAQRMEPVGRRTRAPDTFRLAMARTALALPSVPVVIHALAITRRRPELATLVDQNLNLLFRQAERYLDTILARHGWVIDRPPAVEIRTFWSTVFGARLMSAAGFSGRASDIDLAGVLTVHTETSS